MSVLSGPWAWYFAGHRRQCPRCQRPTKAVYVDRRERCEHCDVRLRVRADGAGFSLVHNPASRISATTRRRILERDGHACRQCGARGRLEIDHIHPVIHGGSKADDNLQVLCQPCNARKGATCPVSAP